jgi:molybdate transport system regulatory protein
MESTFTLNGRIWLEMAGEKVLGHGRVELLERIHKSGSIRQAAMQMEMSYRQAWALIRHINSHFTSPVVISHRGGKGGGNATLTPTGLQLILAYNELQKKFKEFLNDNSVDIEH